MDSISFFKLIKENNFLNYYLFEGEEEYPKEKALNELKKKVLNTDFYQMNETVLFNPDYEEFLAAVETPPWMCERRFILIKESELLEKSASESKTKEKIITSLSSIPETSIVIFYLRGKANKSKKLFKDLDRKGRVVSFEPLTPQQLVKWVQNSFHKNGVAISDKNAEILVLRSGNELLALNNEIEKILSYINRETEVSSDAIKAVATESIEYKVFDLTDALFARNIKLCMELCSKFEFDGISPLLVIALLEKQYRQLLLIKLLSGKKEKEMISQLELHPNIVRKITRLSESYSIAKLLHEYCLCIETELEIKSGKMSEQIALEKLLFELVGKGKIHD